NGCNAAMVVETARLIKAAGLQPRRTIRFVLFSGEEQGMLGSLGYVRTHRQEMDRTVAAIIFDEGTGKYTGYSLGGRGDIKSAIVGIGPAMSAVNADIVLELPAGRKHRSWNNRDVLGQCGAMQLQRVDPPRQLNPQHVASGRPADTRARREILGDGCADAFHL